MSIDSAVYLAEMSASAKRSAAAGVGKPLDSGRIVVRASPAADGAPGLSGQELGLFAALLLFLPLANVVVGHVAYHHRKTLSPVKAQASNGLSIWTLGVKMWPLILAALVLLASLLLPGARTLWPVA